jgi:hypothetical protein
VASVADQAFYLRRFLTTVQQIRTGGSGQRHRVAKLSHPLSDVKRDAEATIPSEADQQLRLLVAGLLHTLYHAGRTLARHDNYIKTMRMLQPPQKQLQQLEAGTTEEPRQQQQLQQKLPIHMSERTITILYHYVIPMALASSDNMVPKYVVEICLRLFEL